MTAAHGPSTVAAVLVAGGSGSRLGAAVPKAFVELEDESLLARAVRLFVGQHQVGHVVVVVPNTHLDDARTIVDDTLTEHVRLDAILSTSGLAERGLLSTRFEPVDVAVVAGGPTRQASVAAGLAVVPNGVEVVLVHDVARPFLPRRVVTAVVSAIREGADAAVPVLPVHDTIRRVAPDGTFAGVVDRSELAAVQTPQGFRREALTAAHSAGERLQVTDDAALVEARGGRVVAVPGAEELFKITGPWDLAVATALIESGAVDG